MKLFAQHGYGDAEKTSTGLERGFIDGVIYSPKDVSAEKIDDIITETRKAHNSAEIFFDPQFYACFAAIDPTSSLGHLNEYSAYFEPRRRSRLLSESRVREDIKNTLEFQKALQVTALLGPNILIPRSFDSTESAISMEFIRNTRIVFEEEIRDSRPVFATLAVGHEAFIDSEELYRFLTDLSALEDNRPDGFYVLMAVNSSEVRSEIFNADVIAGLMLTNHVLKINGYKVIDGYADVLSPFLGAAGADGSATGWWSNLRSFSMDRFGPPRGGRLPTERYLSMGLLNRITFAELDALRDIIPGVLNNLSTDDLYPEGSSQPQRNQEIYQTWETLKELNKSIVKKGNVESLNAGLEACKNAQGLYDRASVIVQFEPKSNSDHIEPLEEGIRLFAKLAELDLGG